MSEDRQRKLALERQRRYLARKRGETVPKLRGGRPRKVATAIEDPTTTVESLWMKWVDKGNRAIFLGTEGGFTHWELGDWERRSVVTLRLPEGPETWEALQRFTSSEMNIASRTTKDKELAAIFQAAADAIDDSEDGFLSAPGEWSKTMLKIGLHTAAEFFEHGRFMVTDGAVYHRVDGGKHEKDDA